MSSDKFPLELVVIPISETVIVPHMSSKFQVTEDLGKMLLQKVTNKEPFAVAMSLRETTEHPIAEANFFSVGSLLHLESIQKSGNGFLVYFKAICRIKTEGSFLGEGIFSTRYSFFPRTQDLDESSRAQLIDFIRKTISDIGHHFQGSEMFLKELLALQTIEEIIGAVFPLMPVSLAQKQEILEIDSEKLLGVRFIDLMLSQKESVEFQIEMTRNFHEKVNKSQREALLREQLKAIQQELGKETSAKKGKKNYRELVDAAQMPLDVKDIALEQVDKLESLGSDNHEAGIVQNYLDLLVALPWKPGEYSELDINEARKILDEDHYGIEKIKNRIMQHLAIMKLKKNKKGSILLFVGPPGVGKTSLGKSIARAMGRKYQRLSLGGIRDEAEIRGHRRTYIGALPGRIITGMKKAGEKNPVFVLDEVDKLMVGYSGDPASALLEVLDPEQNNSFTDHYLDVPYDLSEVFFIATANTTATIPPPLLDRMEVVELSGYTESEKFFIAKKHIIPQILEETGLINRLIVDDSALQTLISKYTREAGVRGLKKELNAVARGASEKVLALPIDKPLVVNEELLKEILGKPKIHLDDAAKKSIPGVVTGLAWTPMGGDILFIEASTMAGRGELILTGQLGDVMKESARISLSLIQSRLVHLIPHFKFFRNTIHIHVPAGAIPKDGPSAGVALFTALVSLLTNKSIDSKLAMTGEVTLRGSVRAVGGIKEKVLAAHRAGIKRIMLSRENEDDLKDIPKEVFESLEFILVDTIEDVIKTTLHIDVPNSLLFENKDTPLEEQNLKN